MESKPSEQDLLDMARAKTPDLIGHRLGSDAVMAQDPTTKQWHHIPLRNLQDTWEQKVREQAEGDERAKAAEEMRRSVRSAFEENEQKRARGEVPQSSRGILAPDPAERDAEARDQLHDAAIFQQKTEDQIRREDPQARKQAEDRIRGEEDAARLEGVGRTQAPRTGSAQPAQAGAKAPQPAPSGPKPPASPAPPPPRPAPKPTGPKNE